VASLVDEAGLADELSSGAPATLFAPNDAAFDALSADVLAELRQDPEQLARALRHHAADGALHSADLRTGPLDTLDGTTVDVTVDGAAITIGGARIVGSDIDAANGVVHTIDQVLVPSWLELDALDPTPVFGAGLDRGRLSLSGTVQTDEQRSTLVERATSAFGADAVDSTLTVDAAAPVDDAAVGAVVAIVDVAPRRLSQASVTFDGTEVTVAGSYVDDEARAAVEAAAVEVGAALELAARPVADAEQAAAVNAELAALVAGTPITFQPGDAELDDAANGVIDRAAGIIGQYGGLAVTVVGYTDTSGSTVDNQLLSDQRAAAVRSALVGSGLDPAVVSSEGRGESSPVIVDGVEDATASRRIEFVVTTTGVGS
jgi:outer membrane protein OmpA-like peptidoglycan-associated protein